MEISPPIPDVIVYTIGGIDNSGVKRNASANPPLIEKRPRNAIYSSFHFAYGKMKTQKPYWD